MAVMRWGATLALGLAFVSLEAKAQQPQFETTRLGDGIYQFRYQNHNGLFVLTPDGIVAFDPISVEASSHYAAEIKRVAAGQPLRAIVYSHDHADHATGAAVLRTAFGDHAPVLAHVNAYQKLVDAADPSLPSPDITFTDRLTLHFGGRTIELHYLGKSHSDNMVVALVPDAKIAFAVDFVANDRMGYRDLPDYHFPDFFEALERLHALEFETIVFGHGPPGDRGSVERQITYYADLRNAVEEAVAAGWSEDEAAERIRLAKYQDWGQYESWFPLNVRAMYRWVKGR